MFIKEHTKEFKDKEYNTRRKNNSFNTSKIEIEFKKWLDDNNINYKYQYKDEKYPFNCDFYFLDKDLYLEIQGNWTHGFHPFNPNDKSDQETLQMWIDKNSKYYNNAIKVWTESDPQKRQWVKEHNLNWIEVFTKKSEDLIDQVKKLII